MGQDSSNDRAKAHIYSQSLENWWVFKSQKGELLQGSHSYLETRDHVYLTLLMDYVRSRELVKARNGACSSINRPQRTANVESRKFAEPYQSDPRVVHRRHCQKRDKAYRVCKRSVGEKKSDAEDGPFF